MKVLMTKEGKRVVLSKNDICLIYAPRNPPNTGSSYTRGTDYYAHKAKSGKWYFYCESWSMWEGENWSTKLISRDNIINKIIEYSTKIDYTDKDLKDFQMIFGENIFEENA